MMGWKLKRDPVSDKLIRAWRGWAIILDEGLKTFAFGAYEQMNPAQRSACREVIEHLHQSSGAYLEVLKGAELEEKNRGD
jgi:hypothetical protein